MIPYAFVINLPHRTDRRDHMTSLLASLNISDYEFVAPVVPSKRDVVAWNGGGVTKNELSLVLTVLGVFDRVEEMGLDTFIVFEDDVLTVARPEDVVAGMRRSVSSLPGDWDMLYFEYCFEACEFLEDSGDDGGLFKAVAPLCAAAIMYNAKSIPKMRSCISTHMTNLDNNWARCIRAGYVTAYLSNPPLFFQDHAFGTNLQDQKTHKRVMSMIVDFEDYDSLAHAPKKAVCRSNVLDHIKFMNVMLALLALTILAFIVCSAVDKASRR